MLTFCVELFSRNRVLTLQKLHVARQYTYFGYPIQVFDILQIFTIFNALRGAWVVSHFASSSRQVAQLTTDVTPLMNFVVKYSVSGHEYFSCKLLHSSSPTV